MDGWRVLSLTCVGLMLVGLFQVNGDAQTQKPKVQLPEPGVTQIQTLEGKFVRVAYNNEGYAIIGYQASNRSLGEEWLLLEIGMTLLGKTPPYTLTRENISLELPEVRTIPLATTTEFRAANPRDIQQRANVQRDVINYFPANAHRACAVLFFPNPESRAQPKDFVDLRTDSACVGRLFFRIPGGIKYGQHWLNIKLKNSLVRVPFRILTKEEEEFLSKNYKDIEQQVKDAFPKKKN
jgi:hypothetical protein